MLHFFNKRKRMKGQIAVVLILFVALGLMLFAVTGNIGRISNTKIDTIIASNSAASKMASLIASYGEYQFVQHLGRETIRCKTHGGFWQVVLGIAFAIITWPFTLIEIIITGGDFALVTGGVFDLGSMSVVYIDPSLAQQWNESLATNLSLLDQTVEQGIQTALQKIVGDQVQVPDYQDMDQDKKYGGLTNPSDFGSAPDFISRFAYYNTKRINSAETTAKSRAVRAFMRALKNLLYVDDTYKSDPGQTDPEYHEWPSALNFGFYDPVQCGDYSGTGGHPYCPDIPYYCGDPDQLPSCGSGMLFPAELDPCCVPEAFPEIFHADGTIEEGNALPDCCGEDVDLEDKCGNPDTCRERSIYVQEGAGHFYPYTYNKYNNEDYLNNDDDPPVLSLREKLGRDDENVKYRKDPDFPNEKQNYEYDADIQIRADNKYIVNDTTGYHTTPSVEERSGVFDTFYKLADWGMELSSLTGGNGLTYGTNYLDAQTPPYPPSEGALAHDDRNECHWCDMDGAENPETGFDEEMPEGEVLCPGAAGPDFGLPTEMVKDSEQGGMGAYFLDLPWAPGVEGYTSYSGGWCVDNQNRGEFDEGNDNPQVLDVIPNLDGFFAKEDECAIGPEEEEPKGWKRGAEMFCNETQDNYDPDAQTGDMQWPYNTSCPKHDGDGNPCTFTQEDEDEVEHTVIYDCACGQSGADGEGTTSPDHKRLWREDSLDALIYEMEQFYADAEEFLSMSPGSAAKTLKSWYEDAAYWIEPGCEDDDCPEEPGDPYDPDNCVCQESFTKAQRKGRLHVWREWLNHYINILDNWAKASYVSNEAWCVPEQFSDQENDAPEGEKDTFDFNENGTRGDYEDVIACLDYNAADKFTGVWISSSDHPDTPNENGNPVEGTVEAVGNAEKFKLCYDRCSNYNCANATLPRSLVPGVLEIDSDLKFKADDSTPYKEQEIYDTCIASTTLLACNDNCAGITDPGSPLYTPSPNSNHQCPPDHDNPGDKGIITAPPENQAPCGYGPDPSPFNGTGEELANIVLIRGLYEEGDPENIVDRCKLALLEGTQFIECHGDGNPPDIDCLADDLAQEIVTCSCYYLTEDDAECRHLCPPDFYSGTPSDFHQDIRYLSRGIQQAELGYDDKPKHDYCKDTRGTWGIEYGGEGEWEWVYYALGDTDFEKGALESYYNAQNQVAKMARRRDFLQGRVTELEELALILTETETALKAFLVGPNGVWEDCEPDDSGMNGQDSPSEALICERMTPGKDKGLPSVAIYVWKDGPQEQTDDSWTGGEWHAVKVESRVPMRCNNACRGDGSYGGSQPWPSIGVKVDKHTFSQKICYFMQDTEGRVKSRVIRADQDKRSGGFSFPGGTGIWNLRFFHPDSGPVGSINLVGGGGEETHGICYDQVDPYLLTNTGQPSGSDIYWKDAFMLNEAPQNPESCGGDPYCECWNAVHEDLIEHGIVTETCAKYFLGSSGTSFGDRGFSLKFIHCDDGFLGGFN